ncbi:MAG: GYF domain-containing protein [Verrucomicrobiaceae bacterium]|nr:GYF domain-containing protein [Verrucomicrobiaceae bacterium]
MVRIAIMDEWHYKRGDASFGPISGEVLIGLRERGRLTGETLVRRDGDDAWMPLRLADPAKPVPVAANEDGPLPPTPKDPAPEVRSVYAPPGTPLRVGAGPVPAGLWCAAALVAAVLLTVALQHAADVALVLWHLNSQGDGAGPPAALTVWLASCSEALAPFAIWLSFGRLLALVFWQGQAFAALRRLYGDAMLHHGPASGFWWFAPFANLVMPFFCLRELRFLSRRQREMPQSGVPFGTLLWCVEGSLLAVVCGRLFAAIEHVQQRTHAVRFDPSVESIKCWFAVAEVAFCVLLATFIIHNLARQVRLHRTWKG